MHTEVCNSYHNVTVTAFSALVHTKSIPLHFLPMTLHPSTSIAFLIICTTSEAQFPWTIRGRARQRSVRLENESNFSSPPPFFFFSFSFNLQSGGQDQERKKSKRRGDLYSIQTSLIVAALKKMLPIGLNMCTPGDQELISLAKTRYSHVSVCF